MRARLAYILPLTLSLVFAILYLNFKGIGQTLIVMLGVPFAAVGAVWTLYVAGFNTSIAVWVGMIALLGVAAETASVMVVYLDGAWKEGLAAGRIASMDEILLDDGTGSDVAKRIAAPMWGGLVSLTLLTLLVVPAV